MCKYKHTHAHTLKVAGLQPLVPSLSWALDDIQASSSWSCRRSPPIWPAVFGVEHQEAPSKSKAPHLSVLPNLTARTHSHINVSGFLSSVFCVFLTWSMTYLNYLMACTVFAQTLETRCCCVRSSEGVNLSATSGYARHNPFLPPYLCPSTSIIPASHTLHICYSCDLCETSPFTVLVAPRRVMMMMMMMMSPLCLSLVLIVFFKKGVCCPSWLAVLLCEVLPL